MHPRLSSWTPLSDGVSASRRGSLVHQLCGSLGGETGDFQTSPG